MKTRRAFTLIELLVIVGLIGAMLTISVLSVQSGREAAQLRGASRDVFAAIRQARSLALVTQQPSIVTFTTETKDGKASSRVEITSVEIVKSDPSIYARNLAGEWKYVGPGAEEAEMRAAASGAEPDANGAGGHTAEEVLFSPVSADVLDGICIKVVVDGEDAADFYPAEDEARKSRVSTFSNVDFLIGKYRKEKEKAAEGKADGDAAGAAQGDTASAGAAGTPDREEKSVAWQVNGRCEPHTVYVYASGDDWRNDAWRIRVDRFGAVRILEDGEDAR